MMKPLSMLLLTFFVLTLAAAPALAQQGKIAFEESGYRFGEVEEGEAARHVFTFRNEGGRPLRILSVVPSCGCTTPDWTTEAVAPGETGTVTVSYDSEGRPGPFQKSIAVRTDGDPRLTTLYISGEVIPPPLADAVAQGRLLIERPVADVGTVPQGRDVWHIFRVKNTGARPIRIQEAQAPAEHLHVEVPARPVFTNEVAEVKVLVNTAALEAGRAFDYAVTLTTDDAEQAEKTLRLRGTLAPGGTD